MNTSWIAQKLVETSRPGLQAVGFWSYLAGLTITSAGILLSHAAVVRFGGGLLIASLASTAINAAKILSHFFRPQR